MGFKANFSSSDNAFEADFGSYNTIYDAGEGGTPTPTQEKAIDITRNGTVEITPDEGYALSKVTANVKVPAPPINLQEKSVIPTKSAQSVVADGGFNGLSKVNVGAIPSEYIVPSGTLDITENGEHDVVEYTKVTVNVPSKEPMIQPLEITENGTYTAPDGVDGYSPITVNVEAIGGEVTAPIRDDVNFYDYDGTLLHSYSLEKAHALTELPPLPKREGLVCQGWNCTLDDIKAHNRAVDIGATYITDDGKTRLYIKISAEGRMDVPLYFSQTVANGVTIDWGDGSPTETLGGTGNRNTVHTYASIGEYVIFLDPADGCTLGLGYNSSGDSVMGSVSGVGRLYCHMLQKVEIGKGVTSIGKNTFHSCYSLANVVIPEGVKSIDGSTFQNCYSLVNIVIPNTVTSIGKNTFHSCYSLANVVIPEGVKSIGASALYNCYSFANVSIPEGVESIGRSMFQDCRSLANVSIPEGIKSIDGSTFQNCYSLVNIVIPNTVTSIGTSAFNSCYAMKFYDFTKHTVVPTLSSTNAFSSIPSDCEIRVPAALYDEWKAATNWSTYASKIVAV